jgi:hypothetical protein
MKIYGTYISELKEFLRRKVLESRSRTSEENAELPFDNIRDMLPYYLTRDQKEGLVRSLRDFPKNANYYYRDEENEIMQGDGWTTLQIFNFDSGERAAIKGIILSNTCDVSFENRRDLPTKIIFAPIIALASYKKLLEKSNLSADSVNNKFDAIRNQKITNIFYLPAGGDLTEEHIALLDDMHSMPLTNFHTNELRTKLFTLSQLGFYIFIFKISVHFCRFHENVVRS